MPTNSLHFAADLYARFYSVYLFYSAFVLFIRLAFLCLPLLYFLSPVFVLVSVRPAVGPNQICHRPPFGHISPYLSYHRAVLSHVPLTNDPSPKKKKLKIRCFGRWLITKSAASFLANAGGSDTANAAPV